MLPLRSLPYVADAAVTISRHRAPFLRSVIERYRQSLQSQPNPLALSPKLAGTYPRIDGPQTHCGYPAFFQRLNLEKGVIFSKRIAVLVFVASKDHEADGGRLQPTGASSNSTDDAEFRSKNMYPNEAGKWLEISGLSGKIEKAACCVSGQCGGAPRLHVTVPRSKRQILPPELPTHRKLPSFHGQGGTGLERAKLNSYPVKPIGGGIRMRRFLLIVLTASFPAIFPGTGIVQAAQRSSREVQKVPGQEVHNLKKQQKAQRKQLKERQQADRKVMSQHATTKDEQARMKRDQKAQRQVLKNQQKQEMSDMKRGHKPPKPHPSHPPRDRGHTST